MSAMIPVWAGRRLKRLLKSAQASCGGLPPHDAGQHCLSARPVDACAPPYDRGFDALARSRVAPITIGPAAGERNEIGADVVLTQDLERLVRWWCAFVRESVDALLSCCHPLGRPRVR